MKRNASRLAKLEERLVGNRSDAFRLNDLEILERIEELEFKSGRTPTKSFLNMIVTADRTRPMFTLKECKYLRTEEAEMDAMRGALTDEELDDHIKKLIINCEMDGTFEDMSEQNIKNDNKTKKETLV
jgi:hypothetical protein